MFLMPHSPYSATAVLGKEKQSCPGFVSWFVPFYNLFAASLLQPFAGGGYRLGATPEEESAYVAGERRHNSAQDVSINQFGVVNVS